MKCPSVLEANNTPGLGDDSEFRSCQRSDDICRGAPLVSMLKQRPYLFDWYGINCKLYIGMVIFSSMGIPIQQPICIYIYLMSATSRRYITQFQWYFCFSFVIYDDIKQPCGVGFIYFQQSVYIYISYMYTVTNCNKLVDCLSVIFQAHHSGRACRPTWMMKIGLKILGQILWGVGTNWFGIWMVFTQNFRLLHSLKLTGHSP